MQKVIFSFIVSLFICTASIAQQTDLTQTLGWDLTYASVLDRNDISPDEFIRRWLRENKDSAVKTLLENWQDESVISVIFADYPAFHAGERIEELFVRTKTRIFYRSFAKGKFSGSKEPIDLKQYETALQKLFAWEQMPITLDEMPATREKTEEDKREWGKGFIGFLNLYEQGKSKQLLLSFKDFMVIARAPTEKEKSDDDEMEKYARENIKTGRLPQALSEIFAGQKLTSPALPNKNRKKKKRG